MNNVVGYNSYSSFIFTQLFFPWFRPYIFPLNLELWECTGTFIQCVAIGLH